MKLPAVMENPLLVKELRGRMRGAKAYWLLFAYLGILSVGMILTYAVSTGGHSATFTLGRIFFQTIFFIQMGLVCLIAPGLTAGAITVEREQRTLDFLVATPMMMRSIVIGKLVSALSFIVLLLTSSVPLVSVCFLLGGVSPGEVIASYLILLLTAFVYGSIGLAWSAVCGKTTPATTATYATVGLFFMVTTMTLQYEGLLALNPIGAFMFYAETEAYYGFMLPAWLPSLLLNGMLGLLLVIISIRKMDPVAADTSIGLRVQSLLLYVTLLFFAFGRAFDEFYRDQTDWERSTAVEWIALLGLLLLVTPVFATGKVERVSGENLSWFFLPGWKRLFRSRLDSSVPFLILLMLVAAVMSLTGFPLTGLSLPKHAFMDVLLVFLVTLVTVVAFSVLAITFSYRLKNRWSAMIVTYLIMVGLILMPFQALPAKGTVWHPLLLPLYLNPFMGMLEFLLPQSDFSDVMFLEVPACWTNFLFYSLLLAVAALKLRRLLAETEQPVTIPAEYEDTRQPT